MFIDITIISLNVWVDVNFKMGLYRDPGMMPRENYFQLFEFLM